MYSSRNHFILSQILDVRIYDHNINLLAEAYHDIVSRVCCPPGGRSRI